MIYPKLLQQLRELLPKSAMSEVGVQKRLERARKYVIVAKAFGTAVLSSPELSMSPRSTF